MDLAEVRAAIKRVIRTHRAAFQTVANDQAKLLELAAITGYAEHYRSHDYEVSVANPAGRRSFNIKTSTRGDPWNFSRFVAVRDDDAVELHMNLKVRSAHDKGIYCVDVGVVRAGCIPQSRPTGGWECLDNASLVTFAEVKKLVVYPMLLAQFVGIVHEIKPKFLAVARRRKSSHPPPTLIALGHFSGNSTSIVGSYRARKINIQIAENYDMRLARIRGNPDTSPFFAK